jgi:phosphatidylglycerophosphate synthase
VLHYPCEVREHYIFFTIPTLNGPDATFLHLCRSACALPNGLQPLTGKGMNASQSKPSCETVGTNPVTLWGLSMTERVRRLAAGAGLETHATAPIVLTNAAHAFDPAWFRHVVAMPGLVLTLGGVPVLAHARDEREASALRAAMAGNGPLARTGGLQVVAYESGPTIENKALRKRETPFLMALTRETVGAAERASYFGAYKGVTDILTKYLWPEWALVLTRVAAKIGMTPNMVTTIGAFLCVMATFAFADGRYWLGMVLGLGFMVLDTVDGKLARCTITSSWWGNVFDHGLDLVHPPIWWWFWGTGLAAWGMALSPGDFRFAMAAIIGGYVVQRVIEGAFMRLYGGIHIHVWRRFDSRFRLITARRNPNMVILFVATLFARPDLGLLAVAWWTVISCAVHGARLAQAMIASSRGQAITSWLSDEAA